MRRPAHALRPLATSLATALAGFAAGDPQADRAVPPTGFTARLTVFTAAAMAFLAVFAAALSLAANRLADRWATELAGTATLRIAAPEGQEAAQVEAALRVLGQTPGIAEARALTAEENRALLEPWLGPDLPLEALSVPRLVEVVADPRGFDAEGLRARLAAEVPGAVLDDHARWREPLVAAAGRLRAVALLALLLIAAATAAMITLAARAALAANAQVIRVLRLVGARDATIAGAFVRRFTLRAGWGALAGTAAGLGAMALLPDGGAGEPLGGLGLAGGDWLWPLLIPPLAAAVAFAATRWAALSLLRGQP